MNPPHSLVLGEVRQPFDHPKQYRVIGFDQHEVYYDVFNPVVQSWSFGLSLSKSYYYRGLADRFFRESTHVRFQPLTEGEANLFRPDLPMRLCRNPSINWSFTPPGDRVSFEIAMRSAGLDLAPLPDLPTPRVVLLASRLKASTLGVLCEAENGASFSAEELLWHAHRVQAERGRNKLPGIGLFRMGHERRGVPSYLVGGYYEIQISMEEANAYRNWVIECHRRGEKIR